MVIIIGMTSEKLTVRHDHHEPSGRVTTDSAMPRLWPPITSSLANGSLGTVIVVSPFGVTLRFTSGVLHWENFTGGRLLSIGWLVDGHQVWKSVDFANSQVSFPDGYIELSTMLDSRGWRPTIMTDRWHGFVCQTKVPPFLSFFVFLLTNMALWKLWTYLQEMKQYSSHAFNQYYIIILNYPHEPLLEALFLPISQSVFAIINHS